MSAPWTKKAALSLSTEECLKRVGAAYAEEFPWTSILDESLCQWFSHLGGARKCRPEYLFLSCLPTISALCGPLTKGRNR